MIVREIFGVNGFYPEPVYGGNNRAVPIGEMMFLFQRDCLQNDVRIDRYDRQTHQPRNKLQRLGFGKWFSYFARRCHVRFAEHLGGRNLQNQVAHAPGRALLFPSGPTKPNNEDVRIGLNGHASVLPPSPRLTLDRRVRLGGVLLIRSLPLTHPSGFPSTSLVPTVRFFLRPPAVLE